LVQPRLLLAALTMSLNGRGEGWQRPIAPTIRHKLGNEQ
jgi:hypothetical protein